MQESEQPAGATAAVPPTQYEVTAIRYGSLRTRKSEFFYRYEAYHEPDAELAMDYFFWVRWPTNYGPEPSGSITTVSGTG